MTHDPHAVLGLPADADLSDEQVRQRYLQLIREFPPEREPAKFAAVRAAYDRLRTLPARARYRLFDRGGEDTLDQILDDVEAAAVRPRPTLAQLIEAAETPRKS